MLKLSLITPSLNQAAFVRQSLQSVASQSVQPFEHIIFDAGSKDGTLEILRQYNNAHSYATLHVGRDRSQTHAINLGFTECSGDVIGWLNTDDIYTSPHVIERVLKAFQDNPGVDVVYGRGRFVDVAGNPLRDVFINTDAGSLPERLAISVGILQPATFMRRSLFERVGKLNEQLHFCMDYEYWIRIAQTGAKFLFLDEFLCDATLHTDSKTMGQRVKSLRETTEMVREQFGFAPVEWLERLADAELHGADGILKYSDKSASLNERTRELFMAYNGQRDATSRIIAASTKVSAQKSAEMLRTLRPHRDAYIVTAFDSAFFRAGLTQLAHLKRHANCNYEVFIFDLGLTDTETAALQVFDNVTVLSLPAQDPVYFDGYFSGATYGFKSYGAWLIGRFIPSGSTALWMDAGIAPIRDMTPIWNTISKSDVFLVDHDDKNSWPFFNANFTSSHCIAAMGVTNEELMAPHIRAGIFGFKAGGRFQPLIDQAYKYSLSPQALAGDKHPPRSGSQALPQAAELRARLKAEPALRASISPDAVQDAFGYYGHRHDQAILSILAYRYGAPVLSAKKYCVADDTSSATSKKNWQQGSGSSADLASSEIAPYYLSSGAICMHHRGTYINHNFADADINGALMAILGENSGRQLHDDNKPEQDACTEVTVPLVTVTIPAVGDVKENDRMSVTNNLMQGAERLATKGDTLKRELQTLPRDPKRTVLNPPSISIVTPNFNSVDYIERTLKSVINQDYPNLEYVVVDGASTDGSQDIITKYSQKLSGYISEPDEGHSDALNKGFAMTSGDIMGWINSDDILLPGSLAAIGEFFAKYPEVEWVTGQPTVIEEDGTWKLHNLRKWSRVRFLNGNYRWIQQESTFWRRSLWDRAGGGLSRDINLAVDFELWVRFFRHAELYTYQLPLGAFRYREGQRSTAFRERYEAEALSVIQREASSLDEDYRKTFQAMLPETIRPLEYLEVGARERELSICDTPTITTADVSKREEVPFTAPPPKSARHDTPERLLVCDDLKRFRGLHSGKRCFVMGNGPSLNKMDLNKLDGEIVFGCNSVFLLFDKIKWRPTFYTCVDSRVLPDRAKDIDAMLAAHPSMTAFFPNEVIEHSGDTRRFPTRTVLPPAKGRYYFKERPNSLSNPPYSMFSSDINDHVVQPYTVAITMLQIAAYMGFSEIYLIGCDTNYTVPQDTLKEGIKSDGEIGLALTSIADNDPNHFDPRYFGAGRKWHDPQPEMMIEHHRHARDACEMLGVKVYNATVGGKLEVYPRRDFDSLFDAAAEIQACTPAAYASIPAADNATKPAAGTGILGKALNARGAEVDETEVVARLLASRRGNNHLMLDVGAHIGTSAQYFDALGWTIHCFEPDPNNRAQLTARFGKTPNVSIDPRAVSDKPAKGLQFFTSAESTGISGLHAFRDTHAVTTKVDATTVGEIVKDRNIRKVDFLKIDVEGFDLNVLKGVPWDVLKPDVVECEFEDSKTIKLGHDWHTIASYLRDRGYSVYVSEWHPIVRYGVAHDWRRVVPVTDCQMPPDAWGNLLAFQKDPGYDTIKAAFEALLKFRSPAKVAQQGAAGSKSANGSPRDSGTIVKVRTVSVPPMEPEIAKQRGRVNMLQKTLGYPIEQTVSPGRMWYSGPAHRIRAVSPRLFELLRFARRSVVHVATSGILMICLVAVATLVAWFSLDPRFAETRPWMLAGTAFGILTAALAYVAARAQTHAAALHIETYDLKAEVIRLKEQVFDNSKTSLFDQKLAYRDAQIGNIRTALQTVTGEFNKLKATLANGQYVETKQIGSVKASISALETTLSGMRADLSGLQASFSGVQTELTAMQATIDTLRAMDTRVQSMDVQVQSTTALASKAVQDVSALTGQLSGITAALESMKAEDAKLITDVAAVSEKVSSVDTRLTATDKWSRFDNATWFQHFNRRLARPHIETFEKEWRKRLSLPIAPATLGYMADRACEIERQLDGRLATSIEDILLRSLVARAVKGKTIDVLEIGTLFATGAAIMFDTVAPHFDKTHFTLLDPLEGYYNQAQADILTGQIVNEGAVRRNLSRVGMSEDQYTLVKHLSTDPEAIEIVGQKSYDVLVIDGDHSYAGVKADFENYAGFVKLGGYIILDDYNSPDWPEVKEYVDKELVGHPYVSPVGSSWRTCVYRVVKTPVKPQPASGSSRTKSATGSPRKLSEKTETE